MTDAVEWVATADREPPDAVPVQWPSPLGPGRVVTGYRFGTAPGRGLWVVPAAAGPHYLPRPDKWRFAPPEAVRASRPDFVRPA